MKRSNTVADLLQMTVMSALMFALLKKESQRPIVEMGQAYSNVLRAALGEPLLTDEEKAFEQFKHDYVADTDNLPEQEHRLDLALGLEREPEHNASYYARGLVGAMHGCRKSIHRGGPDHDPIWGETQ